MNGFEHGGIASFRVYVRGRHDAQAAGQCTGEIGEDVRMQVGSDYGVEAAGILRHSHRHRIHQNPVPRDIGVIPGDFGCNLVPHDHAVPLSI